jgi:hypothetical protein
MSICSRAYRWLCRQYRHVLEHQLLLARGRGRDGLKPAAPVWWAEPLEERRMLSTVTWTGAGVDDLWSNAANWNAGVPQNGDSVVIPDVGAASASVIFDNSATSVTLASLVSAEPFANTGSSRAITSAGVLEFDQGVTLNGGTFQSATLTIPGGESLVVTSNGNNQLNGVTVNGALDMSASGASLFVTGGFALNGTATISGSSARLGFSGSQTVTAGTFELTGASSAIGVEGTSTVTLGSSVVIHAGGGSTVGQAKFVGGTGNLVNQGLIQANVAGQNVTINPSNVFTNNGTVSTINGASLTFNPGGSYSNAGGTISINNGTLVFNGTYDNSNGLGTFTRVGGSVVLAGTFNNIGKTLTLNASIGSWSLDGGNFQGGTLAFAGGASLIPTSNGGNKLTGVVINGDLDLSTASMSLQVVGGLTLNGTAHMTGPNGRLGFSGDQTIAAGTFDMQGAGANIGVEGSSTITFAAPVVIQGGNGATLGQARFTGGTGNIVNQGLIDATFAGAALTINPSGSLTNTGTIRASGGATLNLSPGSAFSNAGGTLNVNGGTLNFATTYNNASGLGTFTRSGGTVNITGAFNNAGSTLTLNATTGSWNLLGGTVAGGTLTFLNGQTLLISSNGGNVLSGVTVNGNLDMSAASAALQVTGGLALNGTASVSGSNARLGFSGSQTVTAGTFDLTGSGVGFGVEGSSTLTLGSAVVLHGGGSATIGQARFTGGTGNIINQGLIQANVPGQNMTINPSSGFTNTGTVSAVNSATITLNPGAAYSNAGGAYNINNGTLVLSGTYDNSAGLGTFTRTGGAVVLAGTFNNTGASLTLNTATGSWSLDSGSFQGGTLTFANGASLIPTSNGANTIGNVVVNGDLDLSAASAALQVTGGLTLNGTAHISGSSARFGFSGTQTVAAGTFDLVGTNSGLGVEGNSTVTFAAPVVIHGGNTSTVGQARFASGTGNIINQGLIDATFSGGLLTVNPTGSLTNTGTLRASTGSTLTLNPGAAYSNAGGTINVNGGTLNLAGTFNNASGIGTFTRSGGTVNVTGTFTNTGSTLTLNATTGSWNLLGGTVNGGTLTFLNGQSLLISSNGNNTFAGVTVNGNLDMSAASASLQITGGLALNGTATVSGSSARLGFSGTQTVTAGTFDLTGSGAGLGVEGSSTLTLGPAVVVHGGGPATIGQARFTGGTGNLVNQGLIQSNVAGQNFTINPSSAFTNNGTVSTINTASLTLNPGAAYSNAGGIYSINNGTLVFNGTYDNSAGLGTFTRSGGSVVLAGTFNNTGASLTLNSATGSWSLDGGNFQGGTLNSASGASLIPTGNGNNKLTGVTVNGDLDLSAASAALQVTGGLTLNGTAHISGSNVRLGFSGDQTIAAGTFDLVGASSNIGIEGNSTVTFAAPVVIHGGNNSAVGQARFVGGTGNIVNLGLIDATFAGGLLTINPSGAFTNNGTVRASVGSSLTLAPATPYSNAGGTIDVNGGTFNFAGTYDNASGLGTFTRTGGVVNITGVFANTGSTLTLNSTTGSWNLAGGDIAGGTIAFQNGQTLVITSNGSNAFVGVTVNGDLDMTSASAALVVSGGLAVNGTVHISGSSARLGFSGDETITSGTYELTGANASIGVEGTSTVTLAAPVLVRGGNSGVTVGQARFVGGTGVLINQGTIQADVAGQTMTINPSSSFVNKGSIAATSNGRLNVTNPAPNQGLVKAGVGGVITYTAALVQTATGTIEVELGGDSPSQIGRVISTTAATLVGTFKVDLANGFQPVGGQAFTVMTFPSATGNFSPFIGLDAPTAGPLTVSLNAASLVLNGNGVAAPPGVFTVTNTNDSGAGSLRQAITDANAAGAAAQVQFAIPAGEATGGVYIISPTSPLPLLSGPGITIDGGTETNFAGNSNAAGPEIVLDGSSAGASADGLTLASDNNTIRGLDIRNFDGDGVFISSGTGNLIAGNFIGLNAAGTVAAANRFGIEIGNAASGNTVGGASAFDRNIISGNLNDGVLITGSSTHDNTVIGNFIGTNAAGAAAVPNTNNGVALAAATHDNTIGGASAGQGNLVSGNTHSGLSITGDSTVVTGNDIGLSFSGGGLGNGTDGVLIAGDDNNLASNTIAFNGANGVNVSSGAGNSLSDNSISSNGLLGIDLGNDGRTDNDTGDADTGANDLQNFPVITVAQSLGAGNGTHFEGTLNSTANTQFVIPFFGQTAGEVPRVLGSVTVTTNSDGDASFNLDVDGDTLSGDEVTATATNNATGSTSEFSDAAAIGAADQPAISIGDAATAEGASGTHNLVFTVSLSFASAQTVTVDFATSSGSADSGVDFNAVSNTVTFPAGSTTRTLSVPIRGDAAFEPDETFSVVLSNPSNATIADDTGTGTISNDDAQVSIAAASGFISESGVASSYFITRQGSDDADLVVHFAVSGSATRGADYVLKVNGDVVTGATVTIPAGSVSAQVVIAPIDDALVENTEQAVVTLTPGAGYSIDPAGASASVLVVDNEATVGVTATDADAAESGADPSDTGTFTVTRGGVTTSGDLPVNFTVAGAAKRGVDYVLKVGGVVVAGNSVTIPDGQPSVDVVVSPIDDATAEPTEPVVLTLAVNSAYAIDADAASAEVDIADNEPIVSIAATDSDAAESGATPSDTGTFRVGRSGGTTAGNLTVNFTRTGSAKSITDYVLTVGGVVLTGNSVVIPDGAAFVDVVLAPVDDSIPEPTETAVLTLVANAAYTLDPDAHAAAVTIDDNEPTIGIAATDDTAAESGATPSDTGTFRITRVGDTVGDFVVKVARTGTAKSVTDYVLEVGGTVLTGNLVTIPDGQAFVDVTVAPIDDTLPEQTETVVLSVVKDSTYTVDAGAPSDTVSILDNESSVGITASPSEATENGDTAVYTITRSDGTTDTDLAVKFTRAGTAKSGVDYLLKVNGSTLIANVVVIPAGQSSIDVTLVPIDDALPEPTETAVVALAAGVGYTVDPTLKSAAATIEDNEPLIGVTTDNGPDTDAVAAESGTPATNTATFLFFRSAGSNTGAITVKFTRVGNAVSGKDYVLKVGNALLTGNSVLIPAGVDSVAVTVVPLDDTLVEATETVRLAVAKGAGYTIDLNHRFDTVTLLDNEPSIAVAASDPGAVESGQTGAFTITRTTANLGSPVTVFYKITGTATNGVDYVKLTGTAVIPAGQASVDVLVSPIDDPLAEGTEDIVLTLVGNAAYSLDPDPANRAATVSITDDEPTIGIEAITPTAAEGGDAGVVRISRTGPTTDALTVLFNRSGTAVGSGTGDAFVDDIAALGVLTIIPAGRAFIDLDITAIADAGAEADETVNIALVPLFGYSVDPSFASATATITDAAPAASPDLVMTRLVMADNQAGILGNPSVHVLATIRNDGGADASASTLTIRRNRDPLLADDSDPIIGSIALPAIPAGTSITVEVILDESGDTSAFGFVLAQVDANNEVTEANETNNLFVTPISNILVVA